MGTQLSWQLDNALAYVSHNEFKLAIDLSQPSQGAILKSGKTEIGRFFCFEGMSSRSTFDSYVRGADLIVSYPADAQTSIDGDVYWRLIESEPGVMAVELIYSLHTQSMDSRPTPVIGFKFLADESKTCSIRNLDEKVLVKESSREIEDNFCLASMENGHRLAVGTFPNDLQRLDLVASQGIADLKFCLRSDFLEKGVIRRLRLLMAVASAGVDAGQLVEVAQEFVSSRLPLTT